MERDSGDKNTRPQFEQMKGEKNAKKRKTSFKRLVYYVSCDNSAFVSFK
jgi:hypothetical protein